MATASSESAAGGVHATLQRLAAHLEQQVDFFEALGHVAAGDGAALGGVWGASRALVAGAVARRLSASLSSPSVLLVVLPHAGGVDAFRDDMALFSDLDCVCFPAWEANLGQRVVHDEIFAARLRLLKRLGGIAQPDSPPPGNAQVDPLVVVTSIQSLMQPVPSLAELRGSTRRFSVGSAIDADELVRWLAGHGMHNTTSVEMPGEFSMRGGIFDLFAADAFAPVRLDLFGDEIESIREFDVATQRSRGESAHVDVSALDPNERRRACLVEYLPKETWVLLSEPNDLVAEGQYYYRRLDDPDACFSASVALGELSSYPTLTSASIPSGDYNAFAHLRIESVEQFSGDIGRVRQELDASTNDQQVYLVCETPAEIERLQDVLAETQIASEGRLHCVLGRLSEGFRLLDQQTVLISAAQLFHRQELVRPNARRTGRAIDSFLELREGDLVVHLAHGIGRYRGIELLSKEERSEEHLELEFDGGTRIFVPASKIELVQKYVGGRKATPALARIGGKSWQRQKQAAEKAVNDLAVDMLQLQAAREARPGIAFPVDSQWQREFDAAFPYLETDDQLAAIEAIKRDMESARPMDRLLCGDVGFGKTEVAMRAAFKAIDAGYQVALLAPTTVLAEQHRRTFAQRMAEFPFEIVALSRFCTTREQRQVVERAAAGTVDLVIGTHRLASPDVQFSNLGLIIIDEEQRFGVEVKERLKAVRASVDVLTMTATPIPRTLHMSLLGVRSISNLETPPKDRLAVETRISRFDEQLIRNAVLRELNRDGQVYFVHNRVHDIQQVARRLEQIVPEAKIGIAHGQMPEGRLEEVMIGFVRRDFDLLLATTIVESGLDIPNANTIFIDDADRYGLADLHQLRGRVGRYKHRAYCYLMIGQQRRLTPEAARRLRAIEEFSQMGAGFALAMRDLELRGAGNLLGAQQSGHIATVGYELYCSLLEKAVRQLKQLPLRESADASIDLPVAAYLPDHYVPDMRNKIDLYRRFARLGDEPQLEELAAELADRFGEPPPPVLQMVELARLRLWAHRRGIAAIRLEDRYVVFLAPEKNSLQRLHRHSQGTVRIADAQSGYLPLPGLVLGGRALDPEGVVAAVKSLLQPIPVVT